MRNPIAGVMIALTALGSSAATAKTIDLNFAGTLTQPTDLHAVGAPFTGHFGYDDAALPDDENSPASYYDVGAHIDFDLGSESFGGTNINLVYNPFNGFFSLTGHDYTPTLAFQVMPKFTENYTLPGAAELRGQSGTLFFHFDGADGLVGTAEGNFTVSPVPEPSTWLVMGIGIALAGALSSRRSPGSADLLGSTA